MSQWAPIAELATDVRTGKLTATELVERSLRLMAEKADYKAILSTLDEPARTRAKKIDAQVAGGEDPGALAGIPFIAKDNFLVFGAETTAASNMLKGFDGVYQSAVIERLEAAGAICVAKANLDAFAHGSSTENSDFYTTKNPADPERVPGGSSGGSGAAVGLDLAPFALGTDTGGSIRQPAAFCGIVGFKPSYGLISRSGVVAMSSSSDCIGPMARTVADAAVVMDVMAGRDELDATTIERDPQPYADLPGQLSGARFAVIKEYMGEGIDDTVRQATEQAIAKIKAAGATVDEISLPTLELAVAVYYVIVPAEIASNLSRYDGQRYGYSAADATTLDESYARSREVGFGNEAQRRIMIGTHVLSSGYYDAYYKRAQLVRTKIAHEFADAFKNYDYLIGPTAPTVAFKPGTKADPLQMYINDLTTIAANMANVPAISIPSQPDGSLPIGLQVMAKAGEDRALLGMAARIEDIV